MKRYALLVAALVALVVGSAWAQGVTVKNYFSQCSGVNCDNALNITGSINHNGSSAKLARGTVTLDGSNPTSAATGLTTPVACFVTDVRATAPGDEVTFLTYALTGATIDIYAWNTNGTDPTLVASTDNNDVIAWVCVGS